MKSSYKSFSHKIFDFFKDSQVMINILNWTFYVYSDQIAVCVPVGPFCVSYV